MKTLFQSTLLLLALLLPATATAHDFEVDGIYYNINGNNVTVTYSGTGSKYSGDVTIPATVIYDGTTYSVTSIDNYAFQSCCDLSSITIPSSVTEIGDYAFQSCSGLISITIPNSVTSIDNYAFYDCSGLTSVIIPNSVTSIGEGAFYFCSGLTNITIPNSITSIGERAFSYCSGLTNITIPNSITSIGEGAFSYCSGLTNINIPNSVTSIDNYAFSYCSSLTSLTIPNSVTSIGSQAFYNCTALTNIDIPNSVTSIGRNAFYGTQWFNNQPDGLVYAGLVAYKYKGTMPNGANIILKDDARGIADGAFSYCSSLTSITIPNSVTSIGNNAFSRCSGLTSVTIPNSVTSIGNSAFWGCSSLTTVFLTGEGDWIAGELPNVNNLFIDIGITGVQSMQEQPVDVFCYAVIPPTCDENSYLNYWGTLHVPAASLAAYFTAPYWCNFANIVGDAVKPNGLSLEKDSLDLVIQEMAMLATTISPVTATSNIINWASSNPYVATVVNGQVTAVGLGECDIVALCADQKAVCHIVVYNDRISVDQLEAQLLPNHMVTLTPTSLAATLPALTVTSSDPTVAAARVMNGKVQIVGVTEGTATITVASADGSAKPATCLVTVYTEMGDANGDGFIDIDDVTSLIERVLGNDVPTFKDKNGDMNGDGILDIDDITALINTILGTT